MKIRLGIATCLLAGCATQPPRCDAMPTPDLARAIPGLQRLAHGNPICLGVEFLPPMAEDAAIAVRAPQVAIERAEEQRGTLPGVRSYQPMLVRERTNRHAWAETREDPVANEDPAANVALRFLDDLMGEDRRRLRREIGTPALAMQGLDMQSPGIDLRADELRADDEALWFAENGPRLLRRPLQQMLRRTAWISTFEVQLDELRQANASLLDDTANADDDTDLGRMSMRVRVNRPSDPLEVAYLRAGLRVGTTQEQLKLGYSLPVADDVFLDLRARQRYDDAAWRLRADLRWEVSAKTSVHLVAGDALDFLTTSSVYSLFESPMDGSAGILLYAVHLF